MVTWWEFFLGYLSQIQANNLKSSDFKYDNCLSSQYWFGVCQV